MKHHAPADAITRIAISHAITNARTMIARGTTPRSAAAHAMTSACERFPRADRRAVALQLAATLVSLGY